MILTSKLQEQIKAKMKAEAEQKGTISLYCEQHNINHSWLSREVLSKDAKYLGKKVSYRMELIIQKLGL